MQSKWYQSCVKKSEMSKIKNWTWDLIYKTRIRIKERGKTKKYLAWTFLIRSWKLDQSWILPPRRYRVILKKVSFDIFRTLLVSKEEKLFTIESKDKGLSLSKFSWYLVIVKISKIRHSEGHISQTNHDLKNIFGQKETLHCYCTCTQFSSFC